MKLLIILLLLLGIIYFAVVWFFYSLSLTRRFKVPVEKMVPPAALKKIEANNRRLMEHPNERVIMTSRDGLKLVGHWFHRPDAKRTLLLCHGWRSNWKIDFAAASLWLYDNQCNLLLIEQRAQGESEGKYMGYGITERLDVVDWANWCVRQEPELPLYLYGTSMGAATVLMASGETLPPQVKGIIADSGFLSPYEELKDFGKRIFHVPEYPFMLTLNWMARAFAKVDLKGTSTREALAKNTLPVLLFHGTNDSFVSSWMSQKNHEAGRGNTRLFLFEGVSHCASYATHTEEYRQAVLELFREAEK